MSRSKKFTRVLGKVILSTVSDGRLCFWGTHAERANGKRVNYSDGWVAQKPLVARSIRGSIKILMSSNRLLKSCRAKMKLKLWSNDLFYYTIEF